MAMSLSLSFTSTTGTPPYELLSMHMIDTGVSNQEMSSCNEDKRMRSDPGATGRVSVNRPIRSGVNLTVSSTECLTSDKSESTDLVLGTGFTEVCTFLRDEAGASLLGSASSWARSPFL